MADIVISDLPAKTSLLDSDMVVIDDGAQSYRVSGAQLREFLKVNFLPIGTVVYSQSNLASDNAGRLPLFTGETIASADTLYPDFYAWVLSHTELQCTAVAYEAALSTYGECPKYVIDTVNKTIRLPKLVNYIKMANTTDKITQDSAGLPNITGTLGAGSCTFHSGSGAFTLSGTSNPNGGSGQQFAGFATFDASSSNAIYGGSNTVTPAHTTLYPWVCAYNAAIPASTAQAAEFQNALSGKVDLASGVSQADVDYVIESYKNGDSWYRIYKSGWCEQGGTTVAISGGGWASTSFLKAFLDTSYNIQVMGLGTYSSQGEANCVISDKNAAYFTLYSGYYGSKTFSWRACGYIS